jgi:hypothetical protein
MNNPKHPQKDFEGQKQEIKTAQVTNQQRGDWFNPE